MFDPLSIASAVSGLVSLTVQATQLTCKYVVEVSHAGETVLQCLQSLSHLRDVLAHVQESLDDKQLASILTRKSRLISKHDVERCEQNVETMRARLATLFHGDGKMKKRHALTWPFKKTESSDLIKQLQGFRDMFATIMAADSLDVSVKSHQVAIETRSAVRDIKDDLASGRRDRATEALLDWIFPEDMERWRLGRDRANWHQGTGTWAFVSTEFLDWIESKDEKRRVLWCSGPPGSGKSVLVSQAISHIQEQLSPASGAPKALVLSHFCDHRDSRTQSLDVIIRHLMRQAALQSDAVLKDLYKAKEYQETERNGRNLRLEELMQIFLAKCLSSDPRFLIVLDGLDECTMDLTGLEVRQEVLQFITKAASTGARVLAASRDLADIRTELCGFCTELKVRAPETDLRTYVMGRLKGIEKRVIRAEGFKEAIVDKVIGDANGIINNIRQIKTFLRESRCDLNKMYQETLTRMMSNDAASAELARRTILWLCYSQRTLRESEIQHALATEMDDEDFDPDGITPGELLQGCYMGLVVCDSDGVYILFHETAYDFFRNSPDFGPAAAHGLIAKTLEALDDRREYLCLLDYAAKHWGYHARQVEGDVIEPTVHFITNRVHCQCVGQAFYYRKRDDEDMQQVIFESLPTGYTALQVACGLGLCMTAERLLAEDDDLSRITQADDQVWTPLISASSYGHMNIVEFLLARKSTVASTSDINDADVVGLNKADKAGWTPLFWAVLKGNEAMAKRLLAAGALTSLKDESNWTPVDWAAFRADRTLVTLLMQYTSLPKGYEYPEVPRPFGSGNRTELRHPLEFSAIFLAAAAGDAETVEMLLQRGATAPLGAGLPPGIYRFLYKGEFLVHRNACDGKGHQWVSIPSIMLSVSFTIRLFEAAIRFDQLAIVKTLVELGVPLGAVPGELKDRSALHIAACCGRKRICEYLISKGADTSSQDGDGHTPLDLAILAADIACVKLLLECKPRTELLSRFIEDGNAPAVLLYGWEDMIYLRKKYGCERPEDMVRSELRPHLRRDSLCMLEGLRSPPTTSPSSQTTLQGDAKVPKIADERVDEDGAIDVLNALLARGCDVNAVEPHGEEQALPYACRLAKPKLVSFLLENGADPNSTGCCGSTCLMMACNADNVSLDLVRVLVDGGADVNATHTDPNPSSPHSPLFNACQKAPAEVVCFLIERGAQVNTYNQFEQHPLHIICGRSLPSPATPNDSLGLIKHVLALSGPDILSRECFYDSSRTTRANILNYAIEVGNWAAVEFLRSRGAAAPNPDIISRSLRLHVTNARGETFQRLINDFGADSSACFGDPTITHCVVEYFRGKKTASDDFEDNIVALKEAGADINAARSDGLRGFALHMVVQCDMDVEFMRILLRHGATMDPRWREHMKIKYHKMLQMLPEFSHLILRPESDDATSEESAVVEGNGYSAKSNVSVRDG